MKTFCSFSSLKSNFNTELGCIRVICCPPSVSAIENVASTIASNILAGELNLVLPVVCYVPSNKFRRICHLRHRARNNSICLPSAALRATNIAYNKHYVQQTLRVTNFTVWLLSTTLYATNFIVCLPSATLSAPNYIVWLRSATLRSKLYRVRHLQHCKQQLTMCVLHICVQQYPLKF